MKIRRLFCIYTLDYYNIYINYIYIYSNFSTYDFIF